MQGVDVGVQGVGVGPPPPQTHPLQAGWQLAPAGEALQDAGCVQHGLPAAASRPRPPAALQQQHQ